MSTKKAIVIGAGFSGLSAATSLAAQGLQVTLLEKHTIPGGRARYFDAEGFRFDMGPSWYWMPDVFERYFGRFGKKPSDYYELVRLDPSYKVVFGQDDYLDIPANMQAFEAMLEKLEPGSAKGLRKFLEQAAYKYQVGINDLVYKPSRSLTEFIDLKLLVDMVRMNIFQSFHKHIRNFFSHEKILQLIEFPILFLGAVPQNTPALYSLMNYADISLGTWYPKGGMHQIIAGMVSLAKEKGVDVKLGHDVTELVIGKNGKVQQVVTSEGDFEADVVVASADYHFVEQNLLPEAYRNYSQAYWEKRVMAPSSLLFYLGLNKKIDGLLHHNLFFDADFGPHSREIYEDPKWPSKPLFYVCATTKTEPDGAPQGGENIFILMPVAPGLEDDEATREKYYSIIMDRLEKRTGENIRDAVVFKRSYAHNDFISDYNAFKGNAYGLANTLYQTAILKPSLKNKKVKNLYYTGQLTVPGPGVPPSLISGQVVAEEVRKDLKIPKQTYVYQT